MSPETASGFAEAFREHRSAFGVSITIGDDEIEAVVTESALARELSEVGGGFHPDADFRATVLLSDLSSIPSLGTRVTYQGKAYKVASLAIQPGGLVGELGIRPAGRS